MSKSALLGYARVSTDDQDLTNQRAELQAAGCSKLFSEKITGVIFRRRLHQKTRFEGYCAAGS